MKVTRIETLRCDAGWRMFSFLKVMTDEGHRRLVGIQRELRQRTASPASSRRCRRS